MTATLVLDEKADGLIHAFRHHSNHPLAGAIRDALCDHGASVHPLKGIPESDPMSKYFTIQVPDKARVALLKALRKLPGVAGAYIKPPASPA